MGLLWTLCLGSPTGFLAPGDLMSWSFWWERRGRARMWGERWWLRKRHPTPPPGLVVRGPVFYPQCCHSRPEWGAGENISPLNVSVFPTVKWGLWFSAAESGKVLLSRRAFPSPIVDLFHFALCSQRRQSPQLHLSLAKGEMATPSWLCTLGHLKLWWMSNSNARPSPPMSLYSHIK